MRTSTLFFLILLATTVSPGQQEHLTWEGYLADQMCAFRWRGALAETYAKRHLRSCNFDEECMASGYGILVNGTFVKLTETSNPKAIAYLESTQERNNIYVKVTGVLVEGKIEVDSIQSSEEEESSREKM